MTRQLTRYHITPDGFGGIEWNEDKHGAWVKYDDALAHEPEASQPDAVKPVSMERLRVIARSFVAAIHDSDPDYIVDMDWNEGVSIINELVNARRALNRNGDV